MNIKIEDYNIRYKIIGQGEQVVVILQGWGTNLEVYDLIAESIKDKYRIIQFDFPGFGESQEPNEAWNVDRYADFFCRFMQALEIKSATLIGHSYGGRVIIKLATRSKITFEINRIVLIDSAGILPKKTLCEKLKVKKYKCLKKILNQKVVYALFPELVDDWKSRQGSVDYRNATPIMRQCLVMAVNEDLTSLLPDIKNETLLIWGKDDTATPIEDAKLMEKMIPNSGLVVLEEAGHFPFLEQPKRFCNIMKSYFQVGI